ncbi:hypothetical protein M6B38_127085 [Iris pallida]|uniref:Uncharacterized protein n=1 Tax=Iris pallida TaxID=29817 RepID=A0AAX6GFH1_IRIPA|nr:hypothetical protein M6B38_127085 [Iris pallida]
MMMDGTFYNILLYHEYNLYGISLIPFFASKKKKQKKNKKKKQKKKPMVKMIWLGFSPSNGEAAPLQPFVGKRDEENGVHLHIVSDHGLKPNLQENIMNFSL